MRLGGTARGLALPGRAVVLMLPVQHYVAVHRLLELLAQSVCLEPVMDPGANALYFITRNLGGIGDGQPFTRMLPCALKQQSPKVTYR